jgi:hypothetical protein
MREGLRAEAIELMRSEQEATGTAGAPANASTATTNANVGTTAGTGSHASHPETGAFCPSCGETVTASWRFCSHCGGDLHPPEQASG